MVMRIGGKGIGLIIVFAKMHRDKMIHLDGVDKLLCAAHIILTQAGIDGEHSGIKMWISSGKPLMVEQLDPTQYQSFPLVESRAFAFDLSSLPRDMRVTDMDISIRYAYYSYQVSLYNPTTGEWDEYKRYTVDDITGLAKVETSLPDLQEYLMNGFLYCRFERLGAADGYADIDIPTIIMEGRVE